MTDAKLKSELLNMDLYKLLECEETCTPEQLKKAYRRRALDLHPDKNPDKKEEAERAFIQLGKAFEILADKSARAAYDAVRKAKKEKAVRDSQMDVKRRKMKEDLESREKAARERVEQKEEKIRQERAEQVFYDEIERVSRENRRFLEEENNRIQEQIRQEKLKRASATAAATTTTKTTKDQTQTIRLKLTWPPSESLRLTQQFLEQLFSKYGRIEHLLLGAKAKKPSAILEYARREDAATCMRDQTSLSEAHSINVQCLDSLDDTERIGGADNEKLVGDQEAKQPKMAEADDNNHGVVEGESFEDLEARILKKLRSGKK